MLAGRLTGDEGQVTVRPEGVTVELRLTFPAKLFELVSLTVTDTFVTPVLKLTWPGEEMVKSTTLTATRTVWIKEPLVAITVTV